MPRTTSNSLALLRILHHCTGKSARCFIELWSKNKTYRNFYNERRRAPKIKKERGSNAFNSSPFQLIGRWHDGTVVTLTNLADRRKKGIVIDEVGIEFNAPDVASIIVNSLYGENDSDEDEEGQEPDEVGRKPIEPVRALFMDVYVNAVCLYRDNKDEEAEDGADYEDDGDEEFPSSCAL